MPTLNSTLRDVRAEKRQQEIPPHRRPIARPPVYDLTLATLPPSDPQSPLVVEALRQLHAALKDGVPHEVAAETVLQIIYLADTNKGMRILHQVAQKHGIAATAIRSPDRFKPTVAARRELCRRLRDELHWSLPRIGKFVDRDHTSVLHMLRDAYPQSD